MVEVGESKAERQRNRFYHVAGNGRSLVWKFGDDYVYCLSSPPSAFAITGQKKDLLERLLKRANDTEEGGLVTKGEATQLLSPRAQDAPGKSALSMARRRLNEVFHPLFGLDFDLVEIVHGEGVRLNHALQVHSWPISDHCYLPARLAFNHRSRLIGREQETSVLRDFLTDDQRRLLVVNGPPGSGKSFLTQSALHALQTGCLPASDCPWPIPAICYYHLAGEKLLSAEQMANDLLRSELVERTHIAQFRDWQKLRLLLLTQRLKRTVFLLDDVTVSPHHRTIQNEGVTEFIKQFVSEEEELQAKAILTTHFIPAIATEWPERVTVLTLHRGLTREESLMLLESFTWPAEFGTSLAELLDPIYAFSQGRPKALQRLHARAQLSPAQTLTALREGLSGNLTAQEISVQVNEGMFRLLTPEQRLVLKALEVLDTPVTEEMVTRVIGQQSSRFSVPECLASLCDLPLVEWDGGEQPQRRYFLHSLELNYVRSQSATPGDHKIRQKMFERAISSYRRLAPSTSDVTRSDTLKTWRQLTDIFKRKGEPERGAETLLQIATKLILANQWGFLRDELIPLSRLIEDPIIAMRLHARLGTARYCLGDVDGAEADYDRALELALSLGGKELSASIALGCLNNLANCYFEKGRVKQAEDFYQRGLAATSKGIMMLNGQRLSLATLHRADFRNHQGNFYDGLGACAIHLGLIAQAEECFYKSLSCAEEGIAAASRGNAKFERQYGHDLIKDYRDRNVSLQAHAQFQIASCHRLRGNFHDVEHYHEVGIGQAEDVHNASTISQHYWQRAELYLLLDEFDRAATDARRAATIARQVPDLRALAGAICALTFSLLCLNRIAEAAETITEAIQQNWHMKQAEALLLRGIAAQRNLQYAEASIYFNQVLTELEEGLVMIPTYEKYEFIGLAHLGLLACKEGGDLADVRQYFQRASNITTEPGIVKRMSLLLTEMLKADRTTGAGVIQELISIRTGRGH